MTDLERQLTEALERLSAQYETEQRRQSEHVEALRQQVEALQRQVERLSGQVTDLAGYSGMLPGAQNCTHVGIQNGTVRDRGRGPLGR